MLSQILNNTKCVINSQERHFKAQNQDTNRNITAIVSGILDLEADDRHGDSHGQVFCHLVIWYHYHWRKDVKTHVKAKEPNMKISQPFVKNNVDNNFAC